MASYHVAKDCRYGPKERARASACIQWALIPIQFAVTTVGSLRVHDPVFVAVLLCVIPGVTLAVARGRKLQARLGENLRPTLADDYAIDLANALHVGVSPGSRMANYSGDDSWDIGFAEVGERFNYYGDQASFSLAKGQVVRALLRRPIRAAFSPRLFVEFTEPGREGTRWMIVEARGLGSFTQRYVALQRLRTQLAVMPRGEPAPAMRLPDPAASATDLVLQRV